MLGKRSVAVLALVFILGVLVVAGPAGAVNERDALRGLQEVGVTVSYDSGVDLGNLPEVRLQSDVEIELRKSGIRVSTKDAASQAQDPSILYVHVNLLKSTMMYVYSLTLQLDQRVVLKRNPSTQIIATTWETSSLTFAGVRDPSEKIREHTLKLVDKFVGDYLKANQR